MRYRRRCCPLLLWCVEDPARAPMLRRRLRIFLARFTEEGVGVRGGWGTWVGSTSLRSDL